MPVLLATGLSSDEFDTLKKDKGTGVEKEVSANGRVTQYKHSASYEAKKDTGEVERTGYITEEEPTMMNNIKKWLDDLGPFPFAMLVLGAVSLMFMLYELAYPGGVIFSFFFVWVAAIFCGARAGDIGLPPLVGMITCGFVLFNIGALGDTGDTWNTMNSIGRNIALGIIMLRAGMGMDLAVIRKSFVFMVYLGCMPAIAEAVVVAGIAIVFFDMPITWGLLLGFTLSDVSPAVTTPLLLDFHLQGYGVAKGIPTILLAGGVIGSVFAIIMYGIVFSFIFNGGNPIWLTIVIGLGQVGVGTAVGIVYGEMLVRVWDHPTATVINRSLLTMLSGPFMIFGGKFIGMSGGGTVAVIVCGIYIANTLGAKVKEVEAVAAVAWGKAGQPLLFSLLGAAVSIKSLTPGLIGKGVGIICIGLVGRVIATYSCTLSKDFNFKERCFTCVSWCPKATVQAALSTVALDYVNDSRNASEFDDDDAKDLAEQRAIVVLTVAVLSIIMTAPTFAIAMKYTGENWLVKETNWKDGRKLDGYDDEELMDEFAGDFELTVNMGNRKESLSSSLGHRKVSFQADPLKPGARKLSIQHTEVTPRGVAPRNRAQSNPATLKAMGFSERGATYGPGEVPRPDFGIDATL